MDADCDGDTDQGLGWASRRPPLTSLLLTLHFWGLWGVHRDPLPSCLGSVNWSFGCSQAWRACFAPRPGIGVEAREKQKETGQRYSVILGETPRHPHTPRALIPQAANQCRKLDIHCRGWNGTTGGKPGQAECNGKAALGYLPRRDYPGWTGPQGSPSTRAHLITEGLQGLRCGCHLASSAGTWPEGVVDGLDEKGKCHHPLALVSWLMSICLAANGGLAISSGQRPESAFNQQPAAPCPPCPLSHPGGAAVKNLPADAGDTGDVGSIPGSGRSPREGNGNPLQFPCLENSMDRGAWQTAVSGVGHD